MLHIFEKSAKQRLMLVSSQPVRVSAVLPIKLKKMAD